MANYTVRADGTAANKAAAQDGDPDVQSECMSLATAIGETYSPNDFVLLASSGGTYRSTLTMPAGGTNGNPVTWKNYPGHSPVIVGSDDMTDGSYQWIASGGGTNEWRLASLGGGNPGIAEPDHCFLNGSRINEGSAPGSLADHEWVWGDGDSLGYSTLYFRDDTGDPDTSGVTIEAPQRDICINCSTRNDFVVDGINVKWANRFGIQLVGGTRWEVKNLNASYNYLPGIKLDYSGSNFCTYSTISNCTIEYNMADGIGVGSGESAAGPFHQYITVTGCYIANQLNAGPGDLDGSGLKAFGLHNSTIEKSIWINNPFGAVRLDGGEEYGCDYNTVQFNYCVGNGITWNPHLPQIYCEFSAFNTVRYNIAHDQNDGSHNIGTAHTRSDDNEFYGNITWGNYAHGSFSCKWGADGTKFYNNVADDGYAGFYLVEATDVTLYNNIVTRQTYADLYFATMSEAQITSDYNIFTSEGTSCVREWGVGSYTLAQWVTYSGEDSHSITTDPDFVDPDFTNPYEPKYWLSPGSPAIGMAKADLGSPYNMMLAPGSVWPDQVTLVNQNDY